MYTPSVEVRRSTCLPCREQWRGATLLKSDERRKRKEEEKKTGNHLGLTMLLIKQDVHGSKQIFDKSSTHRSLWYIILQYVFVFS